MYQTKTENLNRKCNSQDPTKIIKTVYYDKSMLKNGFIINYFGFYNNLSFKGLQNLENSIFHAGNLITFENKDDLNTFVSINQLLKVKSKEDIYLEGYYLNQENFKLLIDFQPEESFKEKQGFESAKKDNFSENIKNIQECVICAYDLTSLNQSDALNHISHCFQKNYFESKSSCFEGKNYLSVEIQNSNLNSNQVKDPQYTRNRKNTIIKRCKNKCNSGLFSDIAEINELKEIRQKRKNKKRVIKENNDSLSELNSKEVKELNSLESKVTTPDSGSEMNNRPKSFLALKTTKHRNKAAKEKFKKIKIQDLEKEPRKNFQKMNCPYCLVFQSKNEEQYSVHITRCYESRENTYLNSNRKRVRYTPFTYNPLDYENFKKKPKPPL